MIAIPSIAERLPPAPASARDQAPAGKSSYKDAGAEKGQSSSFRELFHQSSTQASEPTKNEGKQKKSGSNSHGIDGQTTAVAAAAPGDNLATRRPTLSGPPSSANQAGVVLPADSNSHGLDGQTTVIAAAVPGDSGATRRPTPSGPPFPANPAGVMLPAELQVPLSVNGEELSVEWNNGTGSPAALAFALRLKPLASAALAENPGELSLPASPGLAAKAGEIPNSAQGLVSGAQAGSESGAQAGSESGASPQGGNPDSNPGNHAGTHKITLADQTEKTSHAATTDTLAPVENASVHAPAAESRVTPLGHAIASPAVPDGPATPKAAAQAAPAPAATSLDLKDAPATARPLQEISLQISSADDRRVDVRLVERAGEIHVSVRTPDVALAHDLRQDLGSLTGKLAQGGYGTEQFTPPSAGSTNLSDQRSTPENQDPSGGHRQGAQHGSSGQQQQPHDERGKRPAWVEEMENSLAQRQTNRSTAWLLNR